MSEEMKTPEEMTAPQNQESMEDYTQELEASFKKIEEGDIITGTVISISDTEVTLDLRYYAEGIIKNEDFSRMP